MNAMQSLGLGDVCLSKWGGSSLPEEPQNTNLSSWPHGLDWHGQNHPLLKSSRVNKDCTEVRDKTSTEFERPRRSPSSYVLLIYMLICTWPTWSHHRLQLRAPNSDFGTTQIVLFVKKSSPKNEYLSLLVLSLYITLHRLLPALIMSGPFILIASTVW